MPTLNAGPVASDLARLRSLLFDAAAEVAVAERAARGRLPWYLMSAAERQTTVSDTISAVDSAERGLREVRRHLALMGTPE